MSSTEASQSGEYALVSSFYGPGAVGGWHLTTLACVISFSLHPRKRSRDSITADLIAVLTFPTVAAAHLINQIRSYPRESTTLAPSVASIVATQIVIKWFVTINMALTLLAVNFRCMRRACLLAIVTLFCVSAECYVFFSFSTRRTVKQNGDARIFSNSQAFFSTLMVSLSCGIPYILHLIIVKPKVRMPDIEIYHASMILIWFLPCPILGSLLSNAITPVTTPSHSSPRIRTAVSKLAHDLIPRSNSSVKELDQAVALLAGATVFGFSLYSTADAYYQAWLSKTRAMTRDIELGTLGRVQAPRR